MERTYFLDTIKNPKQKIIDVLEQNDLYEYIDEDLPYEADPTFSIFMDTDDNDLLKDNDYIEIAVREVDFGMRDIVVCTKEVSLEELYNRMFNKRFTEDEELDLPENFRDTAMAAVDFASEFIWYKGKKLHPKMVILETGEIFSVVEYSRNAKVDKEDYMIYLKNAKVLEVDGNKVLQKFNIMQVFDSNLVRGEDVNDQDLSQLGIDEPEPKTDKLDASMEDLNAKLASSRNPYLQLVEKLKERGVDCYDANFGR